ncbi:LysR family transcriptional regulator [Dyella lipolytica]|uniref:LysR family transcriptional regulator n=1 Tax=Dyella lipolytica TaxID=1867835 RepID=A0ABW8IZH8_9GAMM|nr:LysR family transcriptional regulator [Dyella lipolytica]GLQ46048.1 LysR family transcriptional regulator [Dyella lipolytica]
MLDGVTLDQLRTFIAAAEQGSFSAAGRKLRRAQSVVSQTMANLEGQLGVALFDRSARYPTLTEGGRALLQDARAVAEQMDGFKARAKTLREGLEPELSLSIDVMYPMSELIEAVAKFRITFPHTPLRVFVEVLGAVIEPVLQGSCQIGIVGSLPVLPETVRSEFLLDVPLVTVVSPSHPLASFKGVIPQSELQRHVQLVLTDRSSLSKGQNYGVFSKNTWRLADMGARHAFLRAGFGFGFMPRFMVEDDIASGKLCAVRIELPGSVKPLIPMRAVYRNDAPPGPAGRWLIDHLNGSRRTRSKK